MTSTNTEIDWRSACLFLGAGFSVEMRMPLVWELTNQLKDYLTPTKLREINSRQPRGTALLPEACQLYDELHGNPNLHYEQVVHAIQSAQAKVRVRDNPYHSLALLLTRYVNLILYLKHKNQAPAMAQAANWYAGLKQIADAASPLWVFSLNHDVCVEFICDTHGIPWSNGIPEATIEFLETNREGAERLVFNRIARQDFSEEQNFGDKGVNLLKLHGALDLFIYDDERYMLYVPHGDRVATLERIYERAGYLGADGEKLVALGELALSDLDGEMQFLQPTLLTGHKFEPGFPQHAPQEFLEAFVRKLETFTSLVAIGYSFGDDHVNRIISAWLGRDSKRSVFVVDPNGQLPSTLADVSDQVSVIPEKAVDFLIGQGRSPLSSTDKFLRTVSHEMRDPRKFSEEQVRELLDPKPRLRRVAERVASLVKSGDLREEMTVEELAATTQRITDEIMQESEREFLAKLQAARNPGASPKVSESNSVSANASGGAPTLPVSSSPTGSATER